MLKIAPRLHLAEGYTQAMREAGAALGFSVAEAPELDQARAVAARLMGHKVASAETILAILAIQPASTLVFREADEVTGVLATLLLKPIAEPDLRAGAFSGLEPAHRFLARPSDPVSICYLWGIAGATRTASSAAMELCRRFRFAVLADLTAYALAATPIGWHVAVKRLGLEPVRHPRDDLLVGSPIRALVAA
jgi:hypothetical protein